MRARAQLHQEEELKAALDKAAGAEARAQAAETARMLAEVRVPCQVELQGHLGQVQVISSAPI